MVPQAFVKIDHLPLTANGKVDRAKLPAVESWGGERSSTTTTTQTPVEEVLAGIWSEVLSIATVAVTEDFFELGGHSLLATQMMSRVREAFGVEIGLRELFERPTVKELGQSIERELREGAGVAAPPITRVDRDRELPLSFAQQRLWFIDQLTPGSAFYNIPAAVRLTGDLQVEALEQTFTEVVRRHEVLRTRFADLDDRTVQVIEEPTPIELPIVDLSKLAADEREAEVREYAKAEAEQPFDLSNGPLLRVKLLRLAEQEHVVLLTMHHIVMDGWSLGILVREIAALYEAFINGHASPLEELPVQYADYANWQQEWLSCDVLDAQLSYWKQQLAGVEQGLELRPDKQRPAVQTISADKASFSLSEDLSKQLKEICRREDVTLFMLLLAGFNAVLHYCTAQSDIVIGTTIANRNRAETERLIGFFVNALVLRTDLSGDPTFRELLRRTREVCLDAYAHQDMPFEKLVEELQPERRLSHTPLFQIMFLLQNAPVGTLNLPGLKLSAVGSGAEMAKYDIELVMQESPQGIGATLVYNSDLFEAATIQRLLKLLETGFQTIAEQPDIQLSSLVGILSSQEQSDRLAEKRKREESNFAKLMSTNPTPISVQQMV
jgi:acyl carrier protein